MWRRKSRPVPGGTKAFVYALLVHVTLLALLGISLRFSAPRTEPPRVVQAVVVEEAPKRVVEPETVRVQEAPKPKAEAEAARQAELKQQQEAERRRQKEAERKKKSEAAEKKKATALEKKQAEERRKKEAETALKQQVTAEEQRRADARAQGEVERYKGLIRQKVSRSWNIPAGYRKGSQCTVHVRLVPGGEVLSVVIVKSSGDPVFDRSVENAVYKASPLPVPDDKKLFEQFRDLEFPFNPDMDK